MSAVRLVASPPIGQGRRQLATKKHFTGPEFALNSEDAPIGADTGRGVTTDGNLSEYAEGSFL
jgi:hypothetical protein